MPTPLEEKLMSLHKQPMVAFLRAHPEYFDEALQLTLMDKQPYSWRASWLLWSAMQKNDPRVKKYLKKLIAVLPKCKYNQQREILKILELMEIGEKQQGLLFDYCVAIWSDVSKQASVRYNAFKILGKLARLHPEMKQELLVLASRPYTDNMGQGIDKALHLILAKI